MVIPAAIVIVVIPADPVDTVAPDSKLIAVREVPTDDPALLTSIPETTPVKFDPSPK